MKHTKNGICIFDFGSQYTLLISRKLRELGYYNEVHPYNIKDLSKLHYNVKGIILSGGPRSVTSETYPSCSNFILNSNTPVLGICYGMQLLTKISGGVVSEEGKSEYGKAEIFWQNINQDYADAFMDALPTKQTVWMSHGDHISQIPNDYLPIAVSSSQAIAAIIHKTKAMIGLQFHPEVYHTEKGTTILENFSQKICNLNKEKINQRTLDSSLSYIKSLVKKGKVLVGFSGGIDSTVTSVLLNKALGESCVTSVLIDHGFMRKNEVEQIISLGKKLNIKIEVIDAKETFLNRIQKISDPEEKRKTIGKTFIETFEKFSCKNGPFTHLGQGTLYPDIIESSHNGYGAKKIKSHHNVGGLPDVLSLQLVEPLKYMFKDEVRKIAKLLEIPDDIINRHPFPGPGLAIRIPGEVTDKKIKLLQDADNIFIQALKDKGFYSKVWQAGTILLPIKSVGVMGDKRTYQYTCVLRAVESVDAMTADVFDLPTKFLSEVSNSIIQKVRGINRVLYDTTSKPPATIEWE